MYEIDDQDEVVELADAPPPDVGAPIPHLVCREGRLLLAYVVNEPDPAWDGASTTMVGSNSDGYLVALVQFESPYAHMFGPPNDEAFHGHPLAARGLKPYGVFEVRQSSWIRRLERMNAVHRYHNREQFLSGLQHFVFAFHDTTFECVADGFRSSVVRGSLASVLAGMLPALDSKHAAPGAEPDGGSSSS